MNRITINDISNNCTLDRVNMSEMYGGNGSHCPKNAPSGFAPSRGSWLSEFGILGQQPTMHRISTRIDELFGGSGPMCSPSGRGGGIDPN